MGAYLLWDTNTLFFDAVTSESGKKGNTVTEHPVEAGANITDHVRPNLDQVSLEGFISNAPIEKFDLQQIMVGQNESIPLDLPTPPIGGGLSAISDSISNAIGSNIQPKVATVLTFPDFPDFVSQTIGTLEQLRTQATLLTVVTPSWVYENMVIENVEINGSPETGTGRSFTVELKEIRVVSSSTVAAPTPTIKRADTKKNNGAQAPKTPEPRRVSAIISGAKSLGVIN